MKKLHWTLGIFLSFAMLVLVLITSLQVTIYGDFKFYEKEYEKYGVLSELDMKMEDVMHVTHEMMAYLKGDRDKLSVDTQVDGRRQDFFNEQDRLHMEDVQGLFIGGLRLRLGAVFMVLICFCGLLFLGGNWKYIIPRAFQVSLGITIVGLLGLVYALTTNFSATFTKFHELFFTNDLWMFDPAQDYMIRMLPEGFFYDMSLRIGGVFGISILLLLIASVIWRRKTRHN